MIERVTEAATVEVGKFYLVRCGLVEARGNTPGTFKLGWIPIIGPEHDDVEILRFPLRHYHYDWRFVSPPQARKIGHPEGTDRTVGQRALAAIEQGRDVSSVEWKRRKCLRPMPVFPDRVRGFPLGALEDAFAGARVKPDCRVCPHRGLPLNGLPEKGGVVVCSGHGLAWRTATGELVRRAPSPEPPLPRRSIEMMLRDGRFVEAEESA